MTLTAQDIQVGKTYRAKRVVKVWGRPHNDRTVLYINDARTRVQYDSPTIPDGRHYPTVDMDRFLKYVSHEVVEDESNLSCTAQEQ